MADDVKSSKIEGLKKGLTKFFKDIISELKKVMWPNKSQLTNNTLTVLMSCLLIGAVIWIVDEGVGTLVKFIYGV